MLKKFKEICDKQNKLNEEAEICWKENIDPLIRKCKTKKDFEDLHRKIVNECGPSNLWPSLLYIKFIMTKSVILNEKENKPSS